MRQQSCSFWLCSGWFASFILLLSNTSQASGLSTARFGGEHGHPTTENPTAIYYNPAGIGLAAGTHIFVDGTLALRWASYTRPTSAIDNQGTLTPTEALSANSGKATLFNAVAAPFAGISSDFGSDLVSAGLSFSVPFGGQATWNRNSEYENSSLYPGAADGVQRWYTIDGTLRSFYLTGAVAFHIKSIGLSLGASGSGIFSQVHTIRARNADGTDDLIGKVNDMSIKEGRSLIDAKGWQGGFGVGAVWHWKDIFWIGASYTSQPNVRGGMTLKGRLVNLFGTATEPDETAIELTQTLPDIFRLGVRMRPNPKLELRLFADYTRWSVFKKQCVLDAKVEGRRCDFPGTKTALDDPENFGGPDTSPQKTTAGVTQHLPRFWKDAGGVRFGASYWFIPRIEAYFGLGYDSTAIPVQTIDPALMDAHKMSIAIGGRFQIIKYLALAATLSDVIYFDVNTNGKNVLNDFKPPTKQASADGRYQQNIMLLNVYADIAF